MYCSLVIALHTLPPAFSGVFLCILFPSVACCFSVVSLLFLCCFSVVSLLYVSLVRVSRGVFMYASITCMPSPLIPLSLSPSHLHYGFPPGPVLRVARRTQQPTGVEPAPLHTPLPRLSILGARRTSPATASLLHRLHRLHRLWGCRGGAWGWRGERRASAYHTFMRPRVPHLHYRLLL